MYEVKNVKTFQGHDGQGFTCTLWREGKKVADVRDFAFGGEYEYDFISPAEEKILDDHVKTLPKTTNPYDNVLMDMNTDMFVGMMIDDYETRKNVKRILSKKIIFQSKGELREYRNPQFIRQWKANPEVIRRGVVGKYPDAIILNDLPIEEAVSLLAKQ